jgi:DNA polymerase-3 subunit delta
MDCLSFLEQASASKLQPVYVLFGDEEFLRRQARAAIQSQVLGTPEDSFGLSVHDGEKASFADVHDDLDSLPFLSSRRLVVVENADPFVTRCRAALEKYVASPSATGVLVLEVRAWPSTTRLAKLVNRAGTIECKTLPAGRLAPWCVAWAAARHSKQLVAAAAQLLLTLVGSEMGLLDQELTKLAIYVGEAKRITEADVDQLVGRSRSAETFKMFDAIGAGRPAEALAILARLFEQGEEPLRLLGAFSWQLRRLAQVARLTQQGRSLGAALEDAGIAPFQRAGCEALLRHLGRRRAERLYDWLIETDLGLKGDSPLPPRTQLEQLVVRLARPRDG